jgi:hypothetical protein
MTDTLDIANPSIMKQSGGEHGRLEYQIRTREVTYCKVKSHMHCVR